MSNLQTPQVYSEPSTSFSRTNLWSTPRSKPGLSREVSSVAKDRSLQNKNTRPHKSIRTKSLDRQRDHRQMFCDYMQLLNLDSRLKKTLLEQKKKSKNLAKREQQLKETQVAFGEFLKKIHAPSKLTEAEEQKKEFTTEKEGADAEFNQVLVFLEFDIDQLEGRLERLNKYETFMKDVKNNTPGGQQKTIEEFMSDSKLGVNAVNELLENLEFQQVSQMTSYAQGRAEMKEKERQLETQCEQLRQTDEKLAAVLQNDSQIADMNRAKIRSLKEHLKMVSDYSVRKKAELSAELTSLMAKISEVFKELFPTESRRIDEVQNTPLEKSLEKLKLIEGFLFDLMDQAEAQHCEELAKMVAEKERARMLELGRDSRENLRKATEERNQRCLDRALAPPVAKTGRRPMFRSHLRKTNKQSSSTSGKPLATAKEEEEMFFEGTSATERSASRRLHSDSTNVAFQDRSSQRSISYDPKANRSAETYASTFFLADSSSSLVYSYVDLKSNLSMRTAKKQVSRSQRRSTLPAVWKS